jgi:hypothetical protein
MSSCSTVDYSESVLDLSTTPVHRRLLIERPGSEEQYRYVVDVAVAAACDGNSEAI